VPIYLQSPGEGSEAVYLERWSIRERILWRCTMLAGTRMWKLFFRHRGSALWATNERGTLCQRRSGTALSARLKHH
jgi:hypothetical protein